MKLELAFGDRRPEEYDIGNLYMTDSDTIRIELSEEEADILTFEEQLLSKNRNRGGQKR